MTAPAATDSARSEPSSTQANLEEQVKQAELQVKLASAQASLRGFQGDKQLPKIPDVTARTPTLSDKGGGAAAGLAALKVVACKAPRIVAAVLKATKQGDTIVVLGEASLAPHQGVAYEIRSRTRLLTMTVRYLLKSPDWTVEIPIPEELAPPEAGEPEGLGEEEAGSGGEVATPTVGPPAAQALTFAIDLLEAVSPTVTLSGRDLPTTSTALRAAVAGQLASGTERRKRDVITPDQAIVLTSRSFLETKELVLRVEALRGKTLIAQARLAAANSRLDALRATRDLANSKFIDAVADSTKGDKVALGAEVARVNRVIQEVQEIPGYVSLSALASRATATLAVADAYVASIASKVDGVSLLQAASLAELLTGELEPEHDLRLKPPKDRYLLYVDVTMAGGDVLTTTSLFETSVKASGAAQVVFQLTDFTGKVLASGEEHDVRHEELVKQLSSFQRSATLLITVLLISLVVVITVVLLIGALT